MSYLRKAVVRFLAKSVVSLTGSSRVYFDAIGGEQSRNVIARSFDNPVAYGNAYAKCAPLAAIINRSSKAFTNGKVAITDPEMKEVKGATATALKRLFYKPNLLQTWNQFSAQAHAFRSIYGCAYIFASTPEGYGFERATNLWVLPNKYLTIDYTGLSLSMTEVSEIVKSIQLNGTPLPLENIIFWQDTQAHPEMDMRKYMLADSKLRTLGDPINNIYAAYVARGVLITHRGAIGILSNESKDQSGSINLDPTEKEEVQKDFRKFGLSKEQYQVIITNANLKWQQMAMPTRDLMLFEEIEDDCRQLCDSMEYPFELLGFKTSGALGDQNKTREAKKTLYQDLLIPDAEDLCQVINDSFDLQKQGLLFSIDFSHVEALQMSAREKNEAARSLVEALQVEFENDVITLNMWRVKRGWEPVTGGDKYRSELAGSFGSNRPTINFQPPPQS